MLQKCTSKLFWISLLTTLKGRPQLFSSSRCSIQSKFNGILREIYVSYCFIWALSHWIWGVCFVSNFAFLCVSCVCVLLFIFVVAYFLLIYFFLRRGRKKGQGSWKVGWRKSLWKVDHDQNIYKRLFNETNIYNYK